MANSPKKLSCLEQAVKFLSVRALSTGELIQKLRRKGYGVPEINPAVQFCLDRRYLDDAQYARDYAAMLGDRGCGARLIALKLKQKGIGSELRNQAAPEPEDEQSRAQNALDFKLRMLKSESDPRKKREKAFRFLVSRGFAISTIRELFDERKL